MLQGRLKTTTLLMPSLLALSISSAFAQTAINTPILIGPDNFRDLAGVAKQYGGRGEANTTSNNGVMRTGVFYRTNAFLNESSRDSTYLRPSDISALSGLGIKTVIDLRTVSEITDKPEAPNVPAGARYSNVDIIGGASGNLPPFTFSTPQASVAFMETINQSFVNDSGVRARLAQTYLDLAHAEGAAVYNCTAGKDRTGMVSATLELIAGVDPNTVMQDYLATNAYTAARVSSTLSQLSMAPGGAQMAAIYEPLLGVRASYLQASFDEINRLYGTPGMATPNNDLHFDPQAFDLYLKQGLGLSQADIYVLRGKMVSFQSLPGQAALTGNARSGADFLQALQNSPLSGTYSQYNYYLQSAIDAGNLGGLERQVGGQIHAEAQAYMVRNALRINDAIYHHITAETLKAGESNIWITTLGQHTQSDAHDGQASSSSNGTGLMAGITYRASPSTSLNAGVGYQWGHVNTDGSSASLNTAILTAGGRFAFSNDEEQGAYLAAQFIAGRVDYGSQRTLGHGFADAHGDSKGTVYNQKLELGYAINNEGTKITPKIGIRFTQAHLEGFQETGSELALNVKEANPRNVTVSTGLELKLAEQKVDNLSISPIFNVSWEHLSNAVVTSQGALYGVSVSQNAANDARDFAKVGADIQISSKNLDVKAGLGASFSGSSHDISGRVSLVYTF